MSVDRSEVERIAGLARLRLDHDEAERLTDEMNRILEHATRLRELASEDGDDEAVHDARDRTSGTRASGADEADALRAPLTTFAPEMREGFFTVPPLPGVLADPEGADGSDPSPAPGTSDGSSGPEGDGG